MAVQYNSLIDPLAIILTVPLALAGGILGLYITETAVGATAIVGAVLLVGDDCGQQCHFVGGVSQPNPRKTGAESL